MLKRRTLLTSAWVASPLLARSLVASVAGTCGLAMDVAHANVPTPAQVAEVMPGAKWAGSSRLHFFGFDVYDATLFITADFRSTTFEQRWLAATQEVFPDVRVGDRITGLHRPGIGAQVWLNGQLRASLLERAAP